MSDEIPDDIANASRAFAVKYTYGQRAPRLEKMLAAALLSERQRERDRCAEIAEAERMTGTVPSFLTQRDIDMIEATCRTTARSIAAAIRG